MDVGPSGDAADARSLFVSLATPNDGVVALSVWLMSQVQESQDVGGALQMSMSAPPACVR